MGTLIGIVESVVSFGHMGFRNNNTQMSYAIVRRATPERIEGQSTKVSQQRELAFPLCIMLVRECNRWWHIPQAECVA